MKYIIMILVVVGLAAADFVTGFIKAYSTDSVQSSKMRKGGLNKVAEIVVMVVVCGLDIAMNRLGNYYGSDEFAYIAGLVTASAVFIYIVAMEIISILENYAVINPEASWIAKIIRKLKSLDETKEE